MRPLIAQLRELLAQIAPTYFIRVPPSVPRDTPTIVITPLAASNARATTRRSRQTVTVGVTYWSSSADDALDIGVRVRLLLDQGGRQGSGAVSVAQTAVVESMVQLIDETPSRAEVLHGVAVTVRIVLED